MPTVLQTAPFGHSGNLPCPDTLANSPAAARIEPSASRAAQWPHGCESSFDIVNKIDRQEVDNAVNMAAKEVRNRFDFKGTDASIKWSGDVIEMEANGEERVKAILDVLQSMLVRRKVDLKSLSTGDPRLSGKLWKISATLENGISSDNARKISKLIRDEGPKGIRTQIQGDELRVFSKKRDDLQVVPEADPRRRLRLRGPVHQLPVTAEVEARRVPAGRCRTRPRGWTCG